MAEKSKAEGKALDAKVPPPPGRFAQLEEAVLSYWEKEGIFKKTLEKAAPKGTYVFYDGPPFATGQPHYGHILPGSVKDVIPRFKTMQGFRVARRWGWDCHGLPVETLVEKELSLRSRKDIEDYGIEKFNEKARESVMRFAGDWRRIIPRAGRFVDMEDDYRTMDPSYTESVWWAFKSLREKGLIYKGFKAMHICPRCETTLSNFEVTQGYQDIKDISAYVKFELADEPGTYLLAWTTTPWTLPGNVALAVNQDVLYAKVAAGGKSYVVAKDLAGKIFPEAAAGADISGNALVGRSYKPLFPYYANDAKLVGRANGWKVYAADFVTTEDGTGIVHIAPAFGEDDLALGNREKLPFVQHVGMNGRFKDEVKDFPGEPVKPKGDHMRTDRKVLDFLGEKELIHNELQITHPYPHCWRCETPLLNYAASSWFVKVTDLKDRLVEENAKVEWVPADVRDGRFGKWLSGARDWAISRSRFWGAPIPVWACDACGQEETFGSVKELSLKLPSRTRFLLMRHGEADNNTSSVVSSSVAAPHHLTEKGTAQSKAAAERLSKEKIDAIIVSPLARTRETAEIVRTALGLPASAVHLDKRLREIEGGALDGASMDEYYAFFKEHGDRFDTRPPGGECHVDVRARVVEALQDLDQRFEGKTVLIVSHETPIWLMESAAKGLDRRSATALRNASKAPFIDNGEIREIRLPYGLPHGPSGEIDLHRPYIDGALFSCACGGTMRRVPDVFDCWFESGSMPFAEAGYKGEPLPTFDPAKGKGYPADFIAEGLDQTRGWFYSLIVLGTALFGTAPYKKVIANGLILAENGQKMSKRLKNYPDLMDVVNRYGADALRLYLLGAPVVHGEDLRFSERGVDEVSKKTLGRLDNVLSFLDLHRAEGAAEMPGSPESEHVLDRWIRAKLKELASEATRALEAGELDRAVRPIHAFVDDLSTWYLRRSRDRFKGADLPDRALALATLSFVLVELAKLLAPFAPFYAEHLYRSVSGKAALLSVHLEAWPQHEALSEAEAAVLRDMEEARKVVSIAHEARAAAGIKVRQPLALFETTSAVAALPHFAATIAEEINVKEVRQGKEDRLDTALTPELRAEGEMRELIRAVQDLRKKAGLSQGDRATLLVSKGSHGADLLAPFAGKLAEVAGITKVVPSDAPGMPVDIGERTFSLSVAKE